MLIDRTVDVSFHNASEERIFELHPMEKLTMRMESYCIERERFRPDMQSSVGNRGTFTCMIPSRVLERGMLC